LSKNLENAGIKARRYHLAAQRVIVFLRQQDYQSTGAELKLSRPTAFPSELYTLLREGFRELYLPATPYRQTGVVLSGLVAEDTIQYGLFEDTAKIDKMAKVYASIDELSRKYGKHSVMHGASLPTKLQAQHEGERGDVPVRKGDLFKGETKRQRLGLPMLHIKV